MFVLMCCLAAATAACGKKGPPLPPLVLVPEAPPELTAIRRGDQVALSFRVPAANTDRSAPADLSHLDIVALTSAEPVTAEAVVSRGSRVGVLQVNTPKDPDEPESTQAPQPATGLNQGDLATFTETVTLPGSESARRTYVVQGFSQRGRRGTVSTRVSIPLGPSPPAPSTPRLEYDAKGIVVIWTPVEGAATDPYTYSVYRPGTSRPATASPLAGVRFTDAPVVWDEERCYEVRAGRTVEEVRVEGPASPAVCVTPHDTFAPSTPEGLVSVASDGSVSLIWTANSEADLAGYVVLRAIAPETTLTPTTSAPIRDTNFRDTVPAGASATYAVVAVDKAGNRSEPSKSVTETAR